MLHFKKDGTLDERYKNEVEGKGCFGWVIAIIMFPFKLLWWVIKKILSSVF